MALLASHKRKVVSADNVEIKQDLTFVGFYIKLFGKIRIAQGKNVLGSRAQGFRWTGFLHK